MAAAVDSAVVPPSGDVAERSVLDVDVAIVGAGVAGLVAALRLARLRPAPPNNAGDDDVTTAAQQTQHQSQTTTATVDVTSVWELVTPRVRTRRDVLPILIRKVCLTIFVNH